MNDGPIPTREQDIALLDRLIDDATAAIAAQAGNTSACSLTKAGIAVPALKYAEGQQSALREIRRSEHPRAAAPACLAQWQTALADLERRGASSEWIAYRTGGIDAARGFIDDANPTD